MLKVDFEITPPLAAAIAALKADGSGDRAVIVQVAAETLVAVAPAVPRGASLDADLAAAAARVAALADAGSAPPPAFLLVRLDEGAVRQVTFAPDAVKPRLRMLYAAGSGQLQQAAGVQREVHVTDLAELKASLFAAVDRAAVMTDSERANAVSRAEAAAEAAVAPARSQAMQGLGVRVDAEAAAALKAFAALELDAVLLSVDAKTGAVSVASTVAKVSSADDVAAEIPADAPRFIVLRWPEGRRAVFAYVCPEGSKPKDRMVYAASKGGLKGQLAAVGAGIVKTVELSDPAELGATVEAALRHLPSSEEQPTAPKAPAPAKGHKMLM